MRALVWDLSIPRYALAVATRRKVPSLMFGKLSTLRVRDVPTPSRPGEDWAELAPIQTGLCGSDMSFLQFKASPTLSIFASNPSVLGHEILARATGVGKGVAGVKDGDRVVIDPVLTCETRGLPSCRRCAGGHYGTCERHADGTGAILGYSNLYPGGFSEKIVAHRSQMFRVPDSVSDDRAVLTEPLSVAVHAVMQHPPRDGESVLVIGGGIIAFSTLWALRELYPKARVALFATESYQLDVARGLGATVTLGADGERDLIRAAAVDLGSGELRPVVGRGFLGRGYGRVYDCIGSAQSIDDALRVTGAGGTLVLVGAAGVIPNVDLTTVWTREQKIEGTVYYGFEERAGVRKRTFEIALELLSGSGLPIESLVTHSFSLEEYEKAIGVNLDRRGTRSVKAVLRP